MMAYHDGRADWAEAEGLALKRLFGVAEDEEEALVAELAAVLTDDEIDAALAAFAAFGSTAKIDKEAEAGLREARSSQGERRVAALGPVFLTGIGEAREKICSKAFGDAEPAIVDALKVAQARFADLDLRLAHLRMAEASGALLALADAIQAEYERRKRAEAVLDYDDLIVKTQDLLSRAGAAAWVLFKIDGGIDHILVDEAQDTNPAQWTIIEQLAEEFFAGEGASEKLRTLFAVGDEKQSIYSFQGADPARFGAVGRAFRARARAAQLDLARGAAQSVVPLDGADPRSGRCGVRQAAGRGWPHLGRDRRHQASRLPRRREAGLVELWQVETETKPEPAEAFEPWNEEPGGARSVDALCQRIAAPDQALARRGRRASLAGPQGDGRRYPDPGPPPRSLHRAHVPRAEARRRPGRRAPTACG